MLGRDALFQKGNQCLSGQRNSSDVGKVSAQTCTMTFVPKPMTPLTLTVTVAHDLHKSHTMNGTPGSFYPGTNPAHLTALASTHPLSL